MNNGVNQRPCPQCDHSPYDPACEDPEYAAQPCCGYVEHVDDMTDPDSHDGECVNAPA
jgi:hypothetical protein